VTAAAVPATLLTIIGALSRRERLEIGAFSDATIERALDAGLGPALAHVTAVTAATHDARARSIAAADLAARVLGGEMLDALEQVLVAANVAGVQPIVLKGGVAALRDYPAAHLRTMGDLDLLVEVERIAIVESQLSSIGFAPRAPRRPPDYDRHHHRMPLWHPARDVWVELHTRPYPPAYQLAHEPAGLRLFDEGALEPFGIGRGMGRAFTREARLVYTAARWAEMINPRRGLMPIMDAAMMLAPNRPALDWDRVIAHVRGSWLATALHVLAAYLDRRRLAIVPGEVLTELARLDERTNIMSRRLLQALVDRVLVERRHPATARGRRTLRLAWRHLLDGKSPFHLAALPFRLTLQRDGTD
jgi:hypothetical protein